MAVALDKFQTRMDFKGVGAAIKQLIGPSSDLNRERLYVSHIYHGGSLEIVAIDPVTESFDVFSSALSSEMGAWALAFGADNQLYIGTMPNAHILRLDWKTKTLVDLGRPSHSEQYIWQLTLAADNKIYGCTFPNAKLIRFDPATGKSEDLGRMDTNELYARTIAADNRGFIYVGIGASKSQVVAYEIATGKYKRILPPDAAVPAFAHVHRADNGEIFARVNNRHFNLKGWSATEIAKVDVRVEQPLSLRDGRQVQYEKGWLTVGKSPPKKINYVGQKLSLFRIASGLDGQLYGSTALPLHFFTANPKTKSWQTLGQLGNGELYSLLAFKDTLIGAAYSGDAPLMIYRPSQPYAPSTNRKGNPWLIHFSGENSGWRPMAMVKGGDDKIYIGSAPSYGLLGGALTILEPNTGKVKQVNNLIHEQGIISLAVLPNGFVVGGTSVVGGVGSHPTQSEARLFIYDVKTQQKIFDTVAVPKKKQIDALAVGSDGLVYGFAEDGFFVFDPKSKKIIKRIVHNLGRVIYNAVGMGPKNQLYGISKTGVFLIDTRLKKPRMLATYTKGIDGGFAINGNQLYFISDSKVISFDL